ncbi:MAG: undecaprenyl/decaprenyl-phosphate alpha-N-acetylglucosaminyl 1-phosphate transferase [Bacteroidaceae bacterium]|nr:undecaprenyl/decaprenyl-phosphate alpha-N-acetylglucosaminyl 1-phosphate transferase [Bacteroidaceae bacterium]
MVRNLESLMMTEALCLLVAFFAAALFTRVVMPWLLRLCHKFKLYDLPSERKVHKSGVPRLGGIVFVPAVVVGMAAALACMALLSDDVPETIRLSTLLIGGGAVVVYFIGVVDDIVGCTAWLKFGVQLAAALTFPVCHLYIDSLYGFCGVGELPLVVAYPLTVFVTLLIINAVNLIDGIDGLAGTLGFVALATYGILFSRLDVVLFVLLAVSLCGALSVFLLFNLLGSAERHTKTFMGDSGSLMLGVTLSYFTIKYAMVDSHTLPCRPDGLLMAYSVLLVPCFDLCRVALCRLRRHRGIFEADRTHLHHKFMAAGFSMHATLAAIVALQLAFLLVNIALFHLGLRMEFIVLLDVAAFTALNVKLPVNKYPL